jgi:CheY-like chemotaxis protein
MKPLRGRPAVNKTILLVDDEPDIVEVLTDLMVEAGYRVISAVDGREALERLERDRPDLVMLDVMMPIMSGEDVLAELERRGSLRAVPIVLMSAGSNVPLAEKWDLPYLRKPSALRAVLEVVRRALAASPEGVEDAGT